jgi:hypothetical protein
MNAQLFLPIDLPAPEPPPRPLWLRGDLDAALLPRLEAAHIQLVGIYFSPCWGRWVYRLSADWRGRGETCLDKFAEGVAATVATMEEQRKAL